MVVNSQDIWRCGAFSVYGHETSRMTDAERNQIDSDAETFMRLCSESIKALKKTGIDCALVNCNYLEIIWKPVL